MTKNKIILLICSFVLLWAGLIGKLAWNYTPATGKAMCTGLGVVPFVGEPKFDGPWVELISSVDGTHIKLSNCIAVIWDNEKVKQ